MTLKSSTVFVSVDRETRVFRSVDEVPPEWRKRFERPRGGLKPQTILIADRKGREEILRALQGQPSSVQTRWRATGTRIPISTRAQETAPPALLDLRAILIEAALVAAAAAGLWFAFSAR